MKILLCPYNWFHQPIGGGEIYLDRLSQYLLQRGHEIRAIVGSKESYYRNGIKCHPQGEGINLFTENNDHVQWCDIIITHLIGSAYGYNKAIQHKKPLIFIAHNNSKQYAVIHSPQEQCNVIYNSYQLRDELQKAFSQFNGVVLHPLLPEYKRQSGNKITLI